MPNKKIVVGDGNGKYTIIPSSSVSVDISDANNNILSASNLSISNSANFNNQNGLLEVKQGKLSKIADGTTSGSILGYSSVSGFGSFDTASYTSFSGDVQGTLENIKVKSVSNVSSGTLGLLYGGLNVSASSHGGFITTSGSIGTSSPSTNEILYGYSGSYNVPSDAADIISLAKMVYADSSGLKDYSLNGGGVNYSIVGTTGRIQVVSTASVGYPNNSSFTTDTGILSCSKDNSTAAAGFNKTISTTIGTNAFTMQTWVYLTKNVNSTVNGGEPSRTWMFRLKSTGSIYYIAGVNSSNQLTVYSTANYVSNLTMPIGSWVHLAYVRESATTVKIYCNGTGSNTITVGSSDLATNPELRLGTADNIGQGVDGYMKDFVLYNRALSASEIQNYYNAVIAGTSGSFPTPYTVNEDAWKTTNKSFLDFTPLSEPLVYLYTGIISSSPNSTSNYTWTKPAGCKYIKVICQGGGGGGGGDGTSAGGVGGSGGGYSEAYVDAMKITNASIYAGNGGIGGGGGVGGVAGGGSTFSSSIGVNIYTTGGGGGLANNTTTFSTPGIGYNYTGGRGSPSVSNGTQGDNAQTAPGGGGGAASGTSGANGCAGGSATGIRATSGGAAGLSVISSPPGTNGGDGSVIPFFAYNTKVYVNNNASPVSTVQNIVSGGGGGGGGGNTGSSIAGKNGGSGNYGSGGGGGGKGAGARSSGGNGGRGYVMIICY